jgi:ribonuclease R
MLDKSSLIRFLRENAERPLRPKELARALGVDARDYSRFKLLLRELEEAGEVYRVRKRRYALPSRINLAVGRLQVTRGGHGFVTREDADDQDVFIPASRLGSAYHGDRVVARIEARGTGRNPQGAIVRVLERARRRVVGIFHRTGGFGFLAPSDERLHRDVFVPRGAEGGAADGDVAVVRVVDWGADHHDPVGEVVEVLGRPGEPGVDVLAVVHAHELATEFPAAALAEAEEVGRDARAEDPGRRDCRQLLTFTIDPEDAYDRDDALSIEQLDGRRWRVGVHIADVSHYVREGGAIDGAAFERGTSVYLVDRVLPMLPPALSSGLCSLSAGADRLTLSLFLELDVTGVLHELELVPAIIRSRHTLSYEEAQDILDGKRDGDAELASALGRLRDIAAVLRRQRRKRGSLDFDLPEARVVLNAAGEPTHVHQLLRLESHQLIEEFMVLANEAVARTASARQLPFIYRVHEAPDPERLEQMSEFLVGLGLKLPKNAHRSPRALQRLLDNVDGRPEQPLVSSLLLRSMKQARYSAERAEHFGLASHAYTHFTSPIRRYPDLAVHRILRATVLEGRTMPGSTLEGLQLIAQHSSTCERQAMEAERDSVELKKMQYMERHVGDVFEGTVSGVTSYGLFVLIDGVLAEGLVHVSRLDDDYYHHVEAEHALVGEGGRRRFRLGDRLKVRVVAVNREARELDLEGVE